MRDLLLISDLHLGSHLKPRTRGEFVHLAARIEDVFPRFLAHYQARGTWQLVVNGDFIDFWNIDQGEDGEPEEIAVSRLHAVLDAHPAVEDALVRFLEAGNGIVFVTGNHDAEFLYPRVRAAMAKRLEGAMDVEHESITRTGVMQLKRMESGRVRFVPWFVREEGGAWIEHGHMFDPACSTDAQLSPTRGGRLVQSLAEVATRSFSNLMPEIDYDAPDKWSSMDYLRWASARGVRFMLRVLYLYLRMAGRMLALWARSGRVDAEGKAAHEEKLAKIATNAGLQMGTLTALERMAPTPSSTSVFGTLSVSAFDYVLAFFLPFVLLAPILWFVGVAWWMCLVIALALGIASFYGVHRSRRPRDIARDMTEVAATVGRVTGVPLVLMGHSHRGSLERLGGVVYGNSGSWLDGTHLVVLRDPEQRLKHAELRRWRNGGVQRLQRMEVPSVEPETAGTADARGAPTLSPAQ